MKRSNGADFVRQSYAGAVRQRLALIEKNISNGMRQEAIRKELNEQGFQASLGTFRKSLWRARRWWRAQIRLHLAASAHSQDGFTTPSALIQPSGSLPTQPQQKAQSMPVFKAPLAPPQPGARPRISKADLDKYFQTKSIFTKP